MRKLWVDRDFDFSFDYSLYPEFIARLSATPSSLESIIKPIPKKFLKIRKSNKWSIQENVGHLIIVDELFAGRLDDYKSGAESLRPADVSGARTNEANYNSANIEDLLTIFRKKRMEYIQKLEKAAANLFNKSAWHPRLKKQMRLCDMLYFHAEHDEHHLTKIRDLSQSFL